MKKMKKIMAAAIAMLALSTAGAVTGTVAWFTASNVVSASGMSLQADTEQGINISNEGLAEWKDSAIASHDGTLSSAQAKFIPTTTADAVTWKHGNSDNRDDHTAVGGLTDLVLADAGNGIAKVNNPGNAIHDKNVYLLNKFYLRSSTPMEIAGKTLYCNSVTAERAEGAAVQQIDFAFRILIKYGTAVKIYAPFEDTVPENGAIKGGTLDQVLAENVTVPASTVAGPEGLLEIEVYCYYEGEDSHCKSANIVPNFNTLSVSCKFGTEKIGD